ncbi:MULTISPECIES: hypothetical protein [unclassified Clostridium]|uniref:hypothetical protein n=1 Tax=unclassified Clostridium TaxID=2614128 RepID=UPI0025C57233|nr:MULTISPECIES: hypothetical protein [unclassified Clostridium]
MELSNEEKNNIRFLIRSGTSDGIDNMYKELFLNNAYKELFFLYNKSLTNTIDKHFVIYNMAWVCKNLSRNELAKRYLNEIKEILEPQKSNYKTQMTMVLWLYIELNRSELTKEELLKIYKELYKETKCLGETNDKVLGIKANISLLEGDYEEVINIFKICLENEYIDMASNFTKDIKKEDKNLYNKINKIYKQFNVVNNTLS